MELGLHGIRTTIFGKCFYTFLYYFYIIFMFLFHLLMYLLFYFVYSRHIPLPLFCKYVLNHVDIWDGASLRNSQRSLAVDSFCGELHLGCLRCFCIRFWLFCFDGSH